MKTYMPLNGLRWSRNSGSANCDMPQSAVFGRPGGGVCFFNCFDDNSPHFIDLYPCYIELNCYLCNRSLANICYYIYFKYQYY